MELNWLGQTYLRGITELLPTNPLQGEAAFLSSSPRAQGLSPYHYP